jgi:hypothetical protein
VNTLAQRVAARWLRKQADQAPGQRGKARQLTQPINKPKGVSRQVVQEFGTTKEEGEDTTLPDRRDIRPKDVFTPTPKDVGVKNLVDTGKDLSKALDQQVPKDKGYETVNQLSQYLIRTEGGGEGGPEGRTP